MPRNAEDGTKFCNVTDWEDFETETFNKHYYNYLVVVNNIQN